MSPRTGRPKVDNPKSVSIKVRFDEEMNEALIAYCAEHNISRTEAIRQGLKLLLSRGK
ncbi:CopG family transcriptional regulator [Paenibacillus macerans]|nr:CopG family transcriptional regulator [Paenibacillus macerans]